MQNVVITSQFVVKAIATKTNSPTDTGPSLLRLLNFIGSSTKNVVN